MASNSLGGRIAAVRGAVRQKDFARRFGVSSKTLIRYESDERVPPSDFIQRLVLELGVDANWLLLGVEEPPKPELNSRESALIANYRASPEEARRSVETTAALLAQSKGKDVKKTG